MSGDEQPPCPAIRTARGQGAPTDPVSPCIFKSLCLALHCPVSCALCYPKASSRWGNAFPEAWETTGNHVFPLLSPVPFIIQGKCTSSSTAQAQTGTSPHPEYIPKGTSRVAVCLKAPFTPSQQERSAGEGCSARLGQLPLLLLPPRPLPSYSMRPSWEMCLLPTAQVPAETSQALGQQELLPPGLHCPLCPSQHEMSPCPLSLRSAPAAGITAACGELLCLYLTGITLSLFL